MERRLLKSLRFWKEKPQAETWGGRWRTSWR
jgi:hypothetical protein